MKKIFTLLVMLAMLFSAQTPIFATSVVDNDLSVKTVHLGGNTVGIALYTDGLYVTDTVPIENTDGKFVEVATKAGIKKGDYLKRANGIDLNDVSNLDAVLKASGGSEITFEVMRENKLIEINVKPIKARNTGAYSIGLWLRDSAAGLGTVTFVDPNTNEFAALGHSINDSDTGERLLLSKGRIVECVVTGVIKGKKGSAGELKGSFGINARQIGVIKENSRFGLFGEISNIKKNELIEIGNKESVEIGEAYIYSDFENGQNKRYTVEILSVNTSSKISEKNMVIKITDADLISKTGGIVQGLSGSPIVQDGKLIGAVTHVMINDPTKGYGIFAENMLETAQSVGNGQLKEAS